MLTFTLVLPYYDNPNMLALQYANLMDYPAYARGRVELIVVDDGSPNSPAIAVPRTNLHGLRGHSIIRHLEDRPWHQHAARNTGASQANCDWLILTDMDHVLDAPNFDRLLDQARDHNAVYTFERREVDGTQTRRPNGTPKRHPNSFCLRFDLFWKIGGYDEALCGIYGTDGFFTQRAFSIGRETFMPQVALTRYGRETVLDASTRTLARKEAPDRAGAKRRALAAKEARGKSGVPEVGTIPWERQL